MSNTLNCGPLISIDKESCLNNVGGLEQIIYIWLSSDRDDYLANDSTWEIDQLEYTDGATTPSAVLPVYIEFHKDTATFNESKAGDAAIANETNTVTLTIQINNRQYLKSKAVNILGAGQRELDIVFSQRNGTNWFISNATLTTTESEVGATRGDGSFYTLTFTTEIDHLVYGLTDQSVEDLVSTGKIGT